MKKENIKLPYNKKTLLKYAEKFFYSNKKKVTINYNGKRLNSVYGLVDDVRHTKIPFKFIFKYLIKSYVQKPVLVFINNMEGTEFKNKIYRLFGVRIGKEVSISPGVYLDTLFPELITIKDGTIIGREVTILTHEATIKNVTFGRVMIGKQVTVGVRSVIKCGVSIGDDSVIAMDSLVNKDVPPKIMVGGIPIRVIKKLNKLI